MPADVRAGFVDYAETFATGEHGQRIKKAVQDANADDRPSLGFPQAVTFEEARALVATARPDGCTPAERGQAIVRAVWSERIDARLASLNYEDAFAESGVAWIEADASGNLVRREP
jgi:hypothetical protein